MDIANIFNSKTRKALFRIYFTNPSKGYYLRELERLLNIPVSMIHKELVRLTKDGIFIDKKQGNLKYFYINKSYPLFDELKSIVFKTVGVSGLLQIIFDKMKEVEIAFIYGSFAKNEENAASDIDLFILGNLNENKLVAEINNAEKTLKREINYSLYTRQDYNKKKKKKDSFILDLLENQKIFLKGSKNEL